jgi:hypothetical protein
MVFRIFPSVSIRMNEYIQSVVNRLVVNRHHGIVGKKYRKFQHIMPSEVRHSSLPHYTKNIKTFLINTSVNIMVNKLNGNVN